MNSILMGVRHKIDYHPFGMLVQERVYTANEYRFGFNGKEKDNEVKGGGNQYNYGFRIYNPDLGKFLSVDPLTKSYPWYTPYQFAGNKVICAIDLDGMEEWVISNALNRPEYMGKMWGIIKDSKILRAQWVAVTLASRYKTHKIYYAIIPKGATTWDYNAFTLDGINIRGACELILRSDDGLSDEEKIERTNYINLFQANNLDPKQILKEGLKKEINIVAINEERFENDNLGIASTFSFIHEIVAHVKNNMNGIDKNQKDEHFDFYKEKGKSDKENEKYRQEGSPHIFQINRSKSIAGSLLREITAVAEKKEKQKTKEAKTNQ